MQAGMKLGLAVVSTAFSSLLWAQSAPLLADPDGGERARTPVPTAPVPIPYPNTAREPGKVEIPNAKAQPPISRTPVPLPAPVLRPSDTPAPTYGLRPAWPSKVEAPLQKPGVQAAPAPLPAPAKIDAVTIKQR